MPVMKNKTCLALLAFLFIIISFSCRKETHELPDGTYYGAFSYRPINSSIGKTDNVTLTVHGRKYECSKGEFDFAVGGSGTYKSNPSDRTIFFKNKNDEASSVNKSLALEGRFTYTFHDDALSIVANFGDTVICHYSLKKIR
jgi:hypothetical protein